MSPSYQTDNIDFDSGLMKKFNSIEDIAIVFGQ